MSRSRSSYNRSIQWKDSRRHHHQPGSSQRHQRQGRRGYYYSLWWWLYHTIITTMMMRVTTTATAFSMVTPPSALKQATTTTTTRIGMISSSSKTDEYITNKKDNDPLQDLVLPTDPTKLRYRCRVAYDGTGFFGFQLQSSSGNAKNNATAKQPPPPPPQRTIQGVLEQVLHRRFQRTDIRVVGAGRTDAGVHARGQAVQFDLTLDEHLAIVAATNSTTRQPSSSSSQSSSLQITMNRMLPTDVRVWNVELAPPPSVEEDVTELKSPALSNSNNKIYAWNVMRKSTGKLYSYRICMSDRAVMDPMERHHRWQLDSHWVQSMTTTSQNNNETTTLEVRLSKILQHYEGSHDFVCFAGALEANARKMGVPVLNTVRTITQCQLICEDEMLGYYRIDIYLDGALYKMVRNLVGTAIDVCRGALDEETFAVFLHDNPSQRGLSRMDNICKAAPPQGLTLERVYYDPENDKDF